MLPSGTTGTPKGVLLQHDDLINAIYMTGEAVGFHEKDRVAMADTPGFDASLWELGIALLPGLAIVTWALRGGIGRCGY